MIRTSVVPLTIELPAIDPEALAWEPRRPRRPAESPPATQPFAEPLISLVFATHDDPPDRLHETIATLRAQTYGRWELCIGDAGSTNEATWEALADADASSARISVAFGHPAGNEGEAIAAAYRLAGGSYVAFPGRLKRFAPDALERCVEALRAVPEADVLFADSDLIDAGRFTLIRREFVNKLGGPRAALAASHAADVVAHLAGRTEHVHSL